MCPMLGQERHCQWWTKSMVFVEQAIVKPRLAWGFFWSMSFSLKNGTHRNRILCLKHIKDDDFHIAGLTKPIRVIARRWSGNRNFYGVLKTWRLRKYCLCRLDVCENIVFVDPMFAKVLFSLGRRSWKRVWLEVFFVNVDLTRERSKSKSHFSNDPLQKYYFLEFSQRQAPGEEGKAIFFEIGCKTKYFGNSFKVVCKQNILQVHCIWYFFFSWKLFAIVLSVYLPIARLCVFYLFARSFVFFFLSMCFFWLFFVCMFYFVFLHLICFLFLCCICLFWFLFLHGVLMLCVR